MNIIDVVTFGAILLLVYYAYVSYKLNTYNPYKEEFRMIISTGLETTKWHARHGNSRNRLSPTSDIILRWRELEGDKWERKEQIVEDFRPYLYVNPNHLMVKQRN